MLANDLLALPEPLLLVLDDYHFVKTQRIHEFMDRLLTLLPPAVHLVLISRTEPPLALPRLRVRQQMNELRVADLSFTPAETEHYLAQATGRMLAPDTVAALHEKSEGWITGLYLATLSLNDDASERSLMRHVQANNVNLLDYLFAEVLMKQAPAVQDFLLRTAVLDRFCSELCEAILGDEWVETIGQEESLPHFMRATHRPVQGILEWLARQRLFVVSLDDEGTWYRYHHLFQLMLQRNLQKRVRAAEILTLHERASRWFAHTAQIDTAQIDTALIDEALHHALAADDVPFASDLIETQRLHRLEEFDLVTLDRWLERLPAGAIQERPLLLLLQGWLSVSTYRMSTSDVFDTLQQVDRSLADPAGRLDDRSRCLIRAEATAVEGAARFFRHEFQQVRTLGLRGLEDLPGDYLYMRIYIAFLTALSLAGMGQAPDGMALILRETQNQRARASVPMLWLRAYLATFDYIAGELQRAVQHAAGVVDQIETRDEQNSFVMGVPCRWLGYIFYEWNDLDQARAWFHKIDPSSTNPYLNSQLSLAWIHQTRGESDAAQQIVDQLYAWAIPLNSGKIHNEIASFRARCLHWQGKTELALQALHEVELIELESGLYLNTEMPVFTLAHVLITHDDASNWQRADDLLQTLWSSVEGGQNIPGQVKVLALQALLYQRRGKCEQALAALGRSVCTAQPGGFIRSFVDLGQPMAALLYQLLTLDANTAPSIENAQKPGRAQANYIGQILAAFPKAEQEDALAQRVQQNAQAQLIEALTPRESEILLQLQTGRPNKQIAREMDISAATVKRHTINLYQKLGVNSRKEAVARARVLGILPAQAEVFPS